MRFGSFASMKLAPGESYAKAIDRGAAEVQFVERLGFDDTWVTEVYLLETSGIGASALQQATWLLGQTSRIQVGTAVVTMPAHNPLEIAIGAAAAQDLSKGRLDLGFGRGFSIAYMPDLQTYPGWVDGFVGLGNLKSVPPISESPGQAASLKAKYFESLLCVKGLLDDDTFTYKGDFYEFENVMLPRSELRQTQPVPLWAVAQQATSYEELGRLGYNLMIPVPGFHWNYQSWDETAESVKVHRKAWNEAGHEGTPQVLIRVQVCLDADESRAREVARKCFDGVDRSGAAFCNSSFGKMTGADPKQLLAGVFGGPTSPQAQALLTLSQEEMIDRVTVTGTPQYAVDRFLQMQERLCADGVMVENISVTNCPRDLYWHTLRLLADEVIPHFK